MSKKLIHKQFCVVVLFCLGAAMLSLSAQAAITPEITEIGKGIWRLRFGTPEQFTPETMRERTAELEALKQLPNGGKLPFKLEDIQCRITSSRTVVYAPFGGKHEQIYGFGLDPKAYIQNGFRKRLTVSAAVIAETGASHGPVPFYLDTSGFGIYVDTARVPYVHVGRLSDKATAVVKNAKKSKIEVSEEYLYKAKKSTGKQQVVFDIPGNSKGVDVYVFAGPTMREAVQRYNLFSGGGCMPPMWGLGLKYRTYTLADKEMVMRHAKGLRKHRIPTDMFGLEPGWQTRAYSCSLVWSEERFPGHKEMLNQLNEMGFKVNLWEHVYIHPTSPLFGPLANPSGDYLVWEGLVVDFADPEASKIFADYHDEELIELGVMGFKADECDRQPISDSTPFNYPYCSKFPSGIDGEQMTQLYGYLYQKSIYSAFKKRNQRTWGDVRATSALAAPLPFALYSDAYGFDEYLRQLVNASFTGLLWSPEVREASSLEEFYNRLAMSSFAPQMCMNPWFLPNPLWTQYDGGKNKRNELLPEKEQEKVAARMREIVELRMQFIPYLYSAFYRYRKEGLPPVRSALLDFPEDKKLREIDDLFMFGDNILVAPFKGTSTSRKVYLPQGCNWINFKTHELFSGGGHVMVDGRPGDTPLFVKENTIVPLAKPVQYIAPDTVFQITAHVFGEKAKPFVLFEDDGISFDYEKGNYNMVKLRWESDKGQIKRSGNYNTKRYQISNWNHVSPIKYRETTMPLQTQK